jgi:SAM-dependent methyltransferase
MRQAVTRNDTVWQDSALARLFRDDVRGGLPLAGEQLDIMLRLLAALDRPVRRFADLGCGGGVLGAAILGRFPDSRGVFLDFSPPMLEAARAALTEHGDRARVAAADLATPDWRDGVAGGHFDAVVSGYAIHHLTDARKQALYAEIHDLLAPGGLFVNIEHVVSLTPWCEQQSDALLIDSLHAHQLQLGHEVSRELVAERWVHRADKAANILAPLETQLGWLRDIGYEDVDCWLRVFELAVFGGRRGR